MDYYLLLVLEISQLLALVVGFLFLQKYLPSYLSEKAKNLATKEDIAEITHQIEQVKSEYTERQEEIKQQNRLLLEHAQYKNQLRLAALDRRLEVHQQAYALLQELQDARGKSTQNSGVVSREIGNVIVKCWQWWSSNCLYLEENAREKFFMACCSVLRYPTLRARLKDCPSPENEDAVENNMRTLTDAFDSIVKAVELPSIGPKEYDRVARSEDQDELQASREDGSGADL